MFDLTKPFIHIEDNGDGTMTQTMYVPTIPGWPSEALISVVEGSLAEQVAAMLSTFPPEFFEERLSKTTLIPNDAEQAES